ncbi:hypothetical protein AOQ84DRAFT_421440 [Glonium stellatum]|uniref:Uncharacterized protein n=1 Tax=Glonium stellatum TaxID=574774 RepID=A0A8E2F7M4_9PEZI|nr:hypothetical protein AOQ84DRAFT_421440 [Glonium stellatum]
MFGGSAGIGPMYIPLFAAATVAPERSRGGTGSISSGRQNTPRKKDEMVGQGGAMLQHNVSSATTPRINIQEYRRSKGKCSEDRSRRDSQRRGSRGAAEERRGAAEEQQSSPRAAPRAAHRALGRAGEPESESQASHLRQPYPIINENYQAIPATATKGR